MSKASGETPLSLKALFNAPDGDVELMVGKEKIRAHKLILSARCEKFKAMFASPMKESVSGQVKVLCDDFSAFTALIEYLYTNEVEYSALSQQNVINLGHLSCEYLLPELTSLCRKHLAAHITVNDVCSVLSFAESCDDDNLRLRCFDFIGKNFNKVQATNSLEKLNSSLLVDAIRYFNAKGSHSPECYTVCVENFLSRTKSFTSERFALHDFIWDLRFKFIEEKPDCVGLHLCLYESWAKPPITARWSAAIEQKYKQESSWQTFCERRSWGWDGALDKENIPNYLDNNGRLTIIVKITLQPGSK